MDPTTLAAISIGGTVIVGVAGFGAAVWSTRKTLAASREHRIWDRRAQVYAEVIAAVSYRQLRREYETRSITHRMDGPDDRRTEAYLATYAQPAWFELEARLAAFGSQPVTTGVLGTGDAHNLALDTFAEWQVAEPPKVMQFTAVMQARAAAKKADKDLVNRITAELQGHRPPPAPWRGLLPPDP